MICQRIFRYHLEPYRRTSETGTHILLSQLASVELENGIPHPLRTGWYFMEGHPAENSTPAQGRGKGDMELPMYDFAHKPSYVSREFRKENRGGFLEEVDNRMRIRRGLPPRHAFTLSRRSTSNSFRHKASGPVRRQTVPDLGNKI